MGLKIASLFSGIGTWEVALRDLGIEHELQFFGEIDKFAIRSYCAIHNVDESLNLGDITKLDDKAAAELPDVDMLCYSPPCQAFSVAGNMKGFEDKRGILFFDALRIIKAKKPKYALMENVKGLTTKKFKAEFGEMLKALAECGYANYWIVLNTKNYGIPQNRERVFVVSMLEDRGFNRPKEVHNGLVLKDMLEDEVDEKYYLPQVKVDRLVASLDKKILGNVNPSGKGMNGNVYNTQMESPTITTNKGEGHKIAIPIKNATKKGYELAEEGDSINIQYPDSKTRRGRVQKQRPGTLETSCNQGVLEPKRIGNVYGNQFGTGYAGNVWSQQHISPTLTTMQGGGRQPHILEQPPFRIRKLTPTECWRLQGFQDQDIQKCIDAGISNSQLYKQAGNSITVDVCKAIFKEIAKEFKLTEEEMLKGLKMCDMCKETLETEEEIENGLCWDCYEKLNWEEI